MKALTTTLILTLLVYFLAIWLLILWLKEDDAPQGYYDYRIYKPIESDNPDSLMMMCYVRNTKASRDSIWRMKVGL